MVSIPFRGREVQYVTVKDLIHKLLEFDQDLPVMIMYEKLYLDDIKIVDNYYPGDTASPYYDSDDEIRVLNIG